MIRAPPAVRFVATVLGDEHPIRRRRDGRPAQIARPAMAAAPLKMGPKKGCRGLSRFQAAKISGADK